MSVNELDRAAVRAVLRHNRPQVYSLEQFEAAKTHDELRNAAQRQLVREGSIHNYLRMYDRAWGPERPIFGRIRFMTSENTARKVTVKNYLDEYSSNGGL